MENKKTGFSRRLYLNLDLKKIREILEDEDFQKARYRNESGADRLSCTMWLNEENDKYDQIGNVQVWSGRETNKTIYVGSLKDPNILSNEPKDESKDDDLPF